MREHKYRAWDKKTKQMVEVRAIVYSDFQVEAGCDVDMGDPEVDAGVWIEINLEVIHRNFKDVELMEYIERKDKNNVEICEGDILKDNYGRILLVEWYKYCFSFKAITKTNFLRARDIIQWFEFEDEKMLPEVIGNIYKNPEFTSFLFLELENGKDET